VDLLDRDSEQEEAGGYFEADNGSVETKAKSPTLGFCLLECLLVLGCRIPSVGASSEGNRIVENER
jgi:hypothetical protein